MDSAFDPENRQLYTELLQAPEGYAFDCAIATTYSLDFVTALVIPTAIVFRDSESREDMLRNPMALLEGVERVAEKLAIYCDRGRIKGAKPDAARLMALYENTIVEVGAPGGGAFHPKLWCLRFTADNQPTRIRLAILSRNLTNDRCWDLTLSLDGKVGEAKQVNNAPIVQFLRALPKLADQVTRPAEPIFLRSLVKDVDNCLWDLPLGASKIGFSVNGLNGTQWQLPIGDRAAIISPFVNELGLKKLLEGFPAEVDCHLISRAEELDALTSETRAKFKIKTLHERVSEDEGGVTEADTKSTSDLEGLHAKAYIVEDRTKIKICVGSANATKAALMLSKGRTPNVEVMATLSGPKSRMGTIDSVLFSQAFCNLLSDYSVSDVPECDPALAAERLLEKLQTDIAKLPLSLNCAVEDGQIRLRLFQAGTPTILLIPLGVECLFRPLTLPNEQGYNAALLLAGGDLDLGYQLLGDVTRWLGVRLVHAETQTEVTFSLGAKLFGLPEGRDAAVLRALIANSENFVRYLSLLLGTMGEGSFLEAETAGQGLWARLMAQGDDSLLEPLVRALCGGGSELSQIDNLISRLEDNEGETRIVPESFLALWQSFRPFLAEESTAK